MTSAERAKELMAQFYDELEYVDANHADDMERRIASAITQAQNDKLEEAAKMVERVTEAQAQGWREHPKEDGCGGAIAVSNGGVFAAEAIRNLKTLDTPIDLVKIGMEAFERGLNSKRKD